MKTNWLWDVGISEKEAQNILKNEDHPKFSIYAEKLFSRVSDPAIAFQYMDKELFCRKWPIIKKRLRKDKWVTDRTTFWQVIYERVREELKRKGIKIREPIKIKIPEETMDIAEQIKTARINQGYTQSSFAKRLGVIQQYISKIENGMENTTVKTLKKIADALGVRLTVRLE